MSGGRSPRPREGRGRREFRGYIPPVAAPDLYTFRKDAVPLAGLLPLASPLSLHVDPANVCNFRCRFCPTGDPALLREVGRPSGIMSEAVWEAVLSGLVELVERGGRRLRRLHLYKDGEPLLNPRLARMAGQAVAAGVADSVETTTNASLLTGELAAELVASGLHAVRISVEHVSSEGYRDLTRTFSDLERVVANVAALRRRRDSAGSPLHIHAKILDAGSLGEAGRERFRELFAPWADSLNVDVPMGWSGQVRPQWLAGAAPATAMDGVTPRRGRVCCPEPFAKLAVNWDGSVSACCVDWAHATALGSVLDPGGLPAVWDGQRLARLRRLHLEGRRGELPACGPCDYLHGLPAYGDLDDERARLAELYPPPLTAR